MIRQMRSRKAREWAQALASASRKIAVLQRLVCMSSVQLVWFAGCPANRARHSGVHVGVEDAGGDVGRVEFLFGDNRCQGFRRRKQHDLGDVPAMGVEQPAEHTGKREYVVDLV